MERSKSQFAFQSHSKCSVDAEPDRNHALNTPCSILDRSYCSLLLSFFITMSGIVSTFSYVVNLLPHSSHERLLLIEFLSSAGRESITLVSGFPQYGHLMSISAFLFPFSICAIIIPHALKFLQKFFFFNLQQLLSCP